MALLVFDFTFNPDGPFRLMSKTSSKLTQIKLYMLSNLMHKFLTLFYMLEAFKLEVDVASSKKLDFRLKKKNILTLIISGNFPKTGEEISGNFPSHISVFSAPIDSLYFIFVYCL